jgi:hypothetical protein
VWPSFVVAQLKPYRDKKVVSVFVSVLLHNSRSNINEDFAEMSATMLVNSKAEYAAILAGITNHSSGKY